MVKSFTKDRQVATLFTILTRATTGTHYTVDELVKVTGQSKRQVENYLDMLCDLQIYSGYIGDGESLRPETAEVLNLPLQLLSDGGVCITGPMPAFNKPVRLNREQAIALVLALEMIGVEPEDNLVKKLAEATTNDLDVYTINRLIEIVVPDHNLAVFNEISSGHMDQQVVKITHQKESGEITVRLIEPHTIFSERGSWYVGGYCHTRDCYRTFKMERITSAEILREVFSHPVHPQDTDAPTAIDISSAPYLARLHFENAEDFDPREWPAAIAVPSRAAAIVLDVPFYDPEWIGRQVVSKMGAVTVKYPDAVREAVVKLAQSV